MFRFIECFKTKRILFALGFMLAIATSLIVYVSAYNSLSTQSDTQDLILHKDYYISYNAYNFINTNSDYLKIPVLMYHHISENPLEWSAATISPEQFKRDMKFLKLLGYTPIHTSQYILYHQTFKEFFEKNTYHNNFFFGVDHKRIQQFKVALRDLNLPERPILITFDDGYRSNYVYAYPILKELEMKAVIFPIASYIEEDVEDDKRAGLYLSWSEIKEMYDSGLFDFQSHTYDLHNSPKGDGESRYPFGKGVNLFKNEDSTLYRQRIAEDFLKSKELLEEILGNEVNVLAYPYGLYNNISEEVLKELGFMITFTVEEGIDDLAQKKDLFLIKRINRPFNTVSENFVSQIMALQGTSISHAFRTEVKKKIEDEFGKDDILNNYSEMKRLSEQIVRDDIEIIIDGQVFAGQNKPLLINEVTFIGIRDFANVIGANVEWNEKTREVAIVIKERKIVVKEGVKMAKIDDKEVELNSNPRIIDNSFYIPLRFFVEAIGGNIDWDDVNRHIIINIER